MAAAPRRSGRQRTVNSKYAHDGWDKSTLRILRASSESSGSSPDDSSGSNTSLADEDFHARRAGEKNGEDARQSDGDTSSTASENSSRSRASSIASNEDEHIKPRSKQRGPRTPKIRKQGRVAVPGSAHETPAHSRGVLSSSSRGAASTIYSVTFGPTADDLFAVAQARDTWLRKRDVTLPSRRTISDAIKQSQFLPQTSTEGAPGVLSPQVDLNDDLIFGRAASNQILTPIERRELHDKYLLSTKTPHAVVLGPEDAQQRLVLGYNSSLNFGQPWLKPDRAAEPAHRPVNTNSSRRPYHEGWFLNVGAKVECLAWTPRRLHLQYLAIAPRSSAAQRSLAPGEPKARQGFHPSPPYPASIQIWAFQTDVVREDGQSTLKMDASPVLSMVLGTEWGGIRHLRWCPCGPADKPLTSAESSTLGLLGVISSDGCGRILAVPCPHPNGDTTADPVSLRPERTGFTFKPPAGKLFTTITFNSPSDVLLGASDGSVHLFDLADQVALGIAKQYMRHQIHHTYMTSLAGAISGPFHSLIASISAAGDLVLTDLRHPGQDTVSVSRASLANRNLIFSPFTRSFITILDRAGSVQVDANSAIYIVCHHIRQFPTAVRVMKLPDRSGAATALAGSQWHPCILVGNARGQVMATNYLRRVLPYRKTDTVKAVGAYAQKLCECDWRALTPQDQVLRDAEPPEQTINVYHGSDARPGISRFREGFKLETIEVGHPMSKDESKKPPKKESGIAEPIFEEEQAVTAIDWNPNPKCAGLVAIGWGSGLVRIQDLAHDLQ